MNANGPTDVDLRAYMEEPVYTVLDTYEKVNEVVEMVFHLLPASAKAGFRYPPDPDEMPLGAAFVFFLRNRERYFRYLESIEVYDDLDDELELFETQVDIMEERYRQGYPGYDGSSIRSIDSSIWRITPNGLPGDVDNTM